MEAAFDAVADPERYILLSPEARICPADEPEIRARPDPRLILRAGEGCVARHIARRPIRLGAIQSNRADVSWMHGAHAHAAHIRGEEIDLNIVLLGADFRLAVIRHRDGKLLSDRESATRANERRRTKSHSKLATC